MKYTGNAKSTPMMDSQPPKNGSVQANGTKTVPSMVDSEVNGADETPDISNGHNTERAFENLPHDAEPVAIVGIGTQRFPISIESHLLTKKSMSSSWECIFSFGSLESSNSRRVRPWKCSIF